MKKLNLLFVLFCAISFSMLNAQSTFWTGTTGNWDDPSNWSNGVPTAGVKANIYGASFNVTIPAGVQATTSRVALTSGATLTVADGACLTIENSPDVGLLLDEGPSTVINHGIINVFDSNHPSEHAIEIKVSNFTNSATGTINIDNAANTGIRVASSTLENDGHINIGPNVTNDGIQIGHGTFNNNSGAQVNILGATTAINGTSGSKIFNNNSGATLCIENSNVTTPIGSVTFNNNGTHNTSACTTSGTVSCPPTIPTMGEWSLIILGLIILSIGLVYVMRWKKSSNLAMSMK